MRWFSESACLPKKVDQTPDKYTGSFSRSLIHSFIHSLNHSFIHSSIYSFIQSFTHWFIDSSVHWPVDSLSHCFFESLLRWVIALLIHWFIDSLVNSLNCAWICAKSLMSFHWHLSHHLLIRWCTWQLQPLSASASQKHSCIAHFSLSKLPPRHVPGTIW